MSATVPIPGDFDAKWSSANIRRVALPLLLFALLWVDLIHQLSYMWQTNEQYSFGWFVPVFGAVLLVKRWFDCPAPAPVAGNLRTPIWIAFLALTMLPVRIIHEVNQDWALFSWLLTIASVALTLYAVFLIGGKKWVTHFAFPVCFIFVAVRWPYRVENSLTYRLMGVVAELTVELLSWMSIPATQHGNLIEVSTGVVGVDEACSGIRSFQSSLMAGLLMGELYRLRRWGRVSLVVVGLMIAFLFNLGRTLLLSQQASVHGLSAVDKWHDTAGLSSTVGCVLSLWLLAVFIEWKWGAAPSKAVQEPNSSDPSTLAWPVPLTTFLLRQPAFPSRFLMAVGLWSFFCFAVTELWYRSHETGHAVSSTWWVTFPTNAPSAREIPISKLAKEKLKYDHATTLSWEESSGAKWTAYAFKWDAGVATSRMSARDHRPEYCLGGSGYNCRSDIGIRYLPVHGLELPFRAYTFERDGQVLNVFHCIWEDGARVQKGFGSSKYLDRLETAVDGRRNLGQQTLEIIMQGQHDLTEAEEALRLRLPELIQLNKGGSLPKTGVH